MKRLLALLAVALLISGAGCQLFNSTPTAPENQVSESPSGEINLDDEYGGFTFSDEPPAFGEPESYEPILSEELSYNDPYQYTNEFQNQIRARGARIYRLRAVWGHLARLNPDSISTDFCGLDWSGSMHMEGGIIVIEKVIAFDQKDYIKRIDRSTISWISHTGPHIDGVQVKIIVPPSPIDTLTNTFDTVPTLAIETPPFSRKFTVDELDSLALLEPVDRCGNGISIVSYRINPFRAHGHLMGEWHLIPADTIYSADSTEVRGVVLGKYRGIWFSDNGIVAGYLRGVFGINSNGERVFFGKYVDLNGRFKGILRGNYGKCEDSLDDSFPVGWFKGIWINKRRIIAGELRGHWAADSEGHGYFHGRWKSNLRK